MKAAELAWAKTVNLTDPREPLERRLWAATVLQQHGLLSKKEGRD